MNRISGVNNQLTGSTAKVVEDSSSWFGYSDLLGEKASTLAKRLRPVFESGILKQIVPYIESASFPDELVEIVKAQKLGHYFLKAPHGNDASDWERMCIITEIARVDASAATMCLVQLKLLGRTIELYGTEEQKNEYLPKIRDFKLIGGWGLTERLNGSDASALTTSVKKVGDHYVLNGNKRWIGNANKVRSFMCLLILRISWSSLPETLTLTRSAATSCTLIALESQEKKFRASFL